MYRRNILWGAISALGMAFTASRAVAASEQPDTPARLKVVYHLADLDKVHFVLSNIQNHIDGAGADNVTIALVVHGPALRAFHAESANWDIAHRIGQFSKMRMQLAACANTMIAQNVTLRDLLPGFVSADKGGVVRLAELQSQGYVYLRP
jgi:uncharacterized protein